MEGVLTATDVLIVEDLTTILVLLHGQTPLLVEEIVRINNASSL